LTSELPTLPLFMDVVGISPGADFAATLEHVLAKCFLMIVVIDPKWATKRDRRWRRLIHRDRDIVRMEVRTGLRKMPGLVPCWLAARCYPLRTNLLVTWGPFVTIKRLTYDTHRGLTT
jgi:hypothetical protein